MSGRFLRAARPLAAAAALACSAAHAYDGPVRKRYDGIFQITKAAKAIADFLAR